MEKASDVLIKIEKHRRAKQAFDIAKIQYPQVTIANEARIAVQTGAYEYQIDIPIDDHIREFFRKDMEATKARYEDALKDLLQMGIEP